MPDRRELRKLSWPTLRSNRLMPPGLGTSIKTPIEISDSEDVSDTEPVGDYSMNDYRPPPSPRATDGNLRETVSCDQEFWDSEAGDEDMCTQDDMEGSEELDESTVYDGFPRTPETPQSLPEIPSCLRSSGNATTRSPGSPAFPVEPLPIWKIENKIKELILKPASQTDREEGYTYVYADMTNEAGFFKIGQSQDPMNRAKTHRVRCLHTFDILEMIPRGQGIQWSLRLESLAQTELTNMKYSFDCRCATAHKEYFTGMNPEALEILTCWARWLKSIPYNEKFQLSPFWRDRLRLLAEDTLQSPRCESAECRSAEDLLAGSCQACLRLRLAAWTEVTGFDYFEYECRMKVAWIPLRRVMLNLWPDYADTMMKLVSWWETAQPLAEALSAPTAFSYLMLFVALHIVPRVLNGVSAFYAGVCLLVHWRFTMERNKRDLDRLMEESSEARLHRKAPTTPRQEIVLESVEISAASGSYKKRSVSNNGPTDISDHAEASTPSKVGERPRARSYTPSLSLTEGRTTEITGKKGRKADTKRRKSDMDDAVT